MGKRSSPKKVYTDESNDDTERILKSMKDMKKELLTHGDEVNSQVLTQIQALDDKLSHSINLHGTRLDALETFQEDTVNVLRDLRRDVNRSRDEVNVLRQKVMDSSSHSRRLNIDHLGFAEEKDEEVIPKIRDFWVRVLKIPQPRAEAILLRDCHRIGKFSATSKYPRVIKCAFITMEDRNLVFKSAFRCKNSNFSLRVDMIPEYVNIQKANLEIRKEIREVNPEALASCTFRSYKPVLLVKYRGKVQVYDAGKMDKMDLEPGDRREDQE